ncbi:HlyD family secretion protein [bacterium]|nr:HlyD family secretion protein [bacterium]
MKKGLTWGIILVVVLVLAGVGYHFWQQSKMAESTDDAYIEGDVATISAEVAGRIVDVRVKDNQKVKKGDVLVRIESDDYDSKLAQAERNLRSAQEKALAARADWELTRVQAQSAISEEVSGVSVAQAGVETARSSVGQARERYLQAQAAKRTTLANLERVRTEVDVAEAERKRIQDDVLRYRALYAKDEISRQQLEQAETQSRQAQARVQAAQRQVQAAFSQVGEADAAIGQASQAVSTSQSQVEEARSRVGQASSRLASAQSAPNKIAVAWANVKVAQAEVERAQVDVNLAKKDVQRATVRAQRDGVVSKRSAQVGAYVQKGTPLLALVDPEVWVLANYKETQLEHVRPGMKAEIDVDTYPGKVFHAHVDSLQAGTGARFSLLPPENASGSFVKVVQRVPVKLVLDDQPSQETPLIPGMSVVSRVLVKQ